MFVGKSENDAQEVAAFWHNVEPLVAAGKTVIISHHMSKRPLQGARRSRDRASGSTDIIGGADAALAVEKITASGTAHTVAVTVDKHRFAADGWTFKVGVCFEEPDETGPIWVRYERTFSASEQSALKRTSAGDLTEAFVRAQGRTVTTGEVVAALAVHEVSRRTVDRTLDGLARHGRLRRASQGRWTSSGATEGAR